MKRLISGILCVVMLVTAAGCGNKKSRSGREGGGDDNSPEDDLRDAGYEIYYIDEETPMGIISSAQGGFSTLTSEPLKTKWHDGDGQMVFTSDEEYVPYVSIYRFTGGEIDPKNFVKNVFVPQISKEATEVQNPLKQVLGDKTYWSVEYSFNKDGRDMICTMMCAMIEGSFTTFSSVVFADKPTANDGTFEELIVYYHVGANYYTGGSEPTSGTDQTAQTIPTSQQLSVTPSEVSRVQWTNVTSNDGCFTMKVPAGWNVTVDNRDPITYQIWVKDPSGQKVFYFCTAQLVHKDENSYRMYGSQPPMFIGKNSVDAMFLLSGNGHNYSDFYIINDLGTDQAGVKILEAELKYNGVPSIGFFSASMEQLSYNYAGLSNYDTGLANGITMLIAPKDEFFDWQNVLLTISGSLQFTNSYYQLRNQQWANVTKTAMKVSEYANSSIASRTKSSWESSDHSYDIDSQEQSDATLGRERVYDTVTNEVYYAPQGYSDSHNLSNDSRYVPVGANSDYYLYPVSGTLN